MVRVALVDPVGPVVLVAVEVDLAAAEAGADVVAARAAALVAAAVRANDTTFPSGSRCSTCSTILTSRLQMEF